MPERSRSDVAEKVRAVAGSKRSANAEDEGDDEGLPDPDLVGDLAADYSTSDYPTGDEEDASASVRRRTRRGSSRRRTRP